MTSDPHSSHAAEDKKSDIDNLYAALRTVDLAPWLMSGAMLGCILHQDTLPGDRDIDFGLMATDRDAFDRAIPELRRRGFDIRERFDPVTLRRKNMVTLRRRSLPIDVKFFDANEGYVFREIHKSFDRKAALVWELADFLHFGRFGTYSQVRRRSVLLARVLTAARAVTPGPLHRALGRMLCRKWRTMNTAYGVEIHRAEQFVDTEKAVYAGAEVLIPRNWREYVLEEYGDGWRDPDPAGKGGWNKKSHLVFPKSRTQLKLIDAETLERFRAARLVEA
ncbi:LicD family protein [Roseitranquillus sediminis]|uniref:LicD family protein n=1 Tax=Roseitranquillus sediminis TaxID=2809051 RepID=UPI001D0CB4FD|nr:LicD family protein [Roseitranquillus sediminis]MBM9593926.1 LicD family protein [Roseitranquillus sediminis]